MATADRILALKLIGDVSSIDKSLKKTEGKLKGFGKSAASWTKAAGIGLAIEGVSMLGDAIGNAWDGFREGEKASARLGQTWKNLHMDGKDLQGTIDAISESTLKLGTDDVEALDAFNQALQTTGGDSAKAMKRLKIAQDLVANGSSPNLLSAFKLIDAAGKGSAKVVDKFGLKSDTAAGRIRELGRRVHGAAKHAAEMDPLGRAVNVINEGLEGIVGSFAEGDINGAFKQLEGTGNELNKIYSEVMPKIVDALSKASGGESDQFFANMREFERSIGPKVNDLLSAMAPLWEALAPHLQRAAELVGPLVGILGGGAAGGLTFVLDSVRLSMQQVTDLLNGDFTKAFNDLTGESGAIATLGKDLDTFFLGIPGKIAAWGIDILIAAGDLGWGIRDEIFGAIGGFMTGNGTLIGGLAQELSGFFTDLPGKIGGWQTAIGTAASNVGNAIYNGVISGVNLLLANAKIAFNTIIAALNRINDMSWAAQDIGGWGVPGSIYVPPLHIDAGSVHLWPDIQPLASGGIVTGPTLAMIGEAGPEAVVPLGRRGGGVGTTYNINVHTGVGDPVAIGRGIVAAITAYERRSGRVWRKAS